MLPFKVVPPIIIVELVYAQVFWQNMFALKGGMSATQSPAKIILNRKLDFNAHCKVEFDKYVQTHEEHNNSMNMCTTGAIGTRPIRNTTGGYYFICLDTGRCINHKDWTLLPMPETVIDQVHHLMCRANAKQNLTFTNLQNKDLDELYESIAGIDDDEPDALHAEDDNYYASLEGVDDCKEDEEVNSDYNSNKDEDASTDENVDDDVDSNDKTGDDDDNVPEIPGVHTHNHKDPKKRKTQEWIMKTKEWMMKMSQWMMQLQEWMKKIQETAMRKKTMPHKQTRSQQSMITPLPEV